MNRNFAIAISCMKKEAERLSVIANYNPESAKQRRAIIDAIKFFMDFGNPKPKNKRKPQTRRQSLETT